MKPIDTSKIELHPIDTNEIVLHPEEQEEGLLSNLKDTAMGALQGVTFGGADEIGGGLQAILASLSPSNKQEADSSIADLYRQKQQALQKSFEESKERSPWLYTGGQIVGGATSGSAIGGLLGLGGATAGAVEGAGAGDAIAGASALAGEAAPVLTSGQRLLALGGRGLETYKKALPVIAGESALSSEKGGLTSIEEAKQLGKDVLGGAAFALPATLGLQALGEGAKLGAGGLKNWVRGEVEDSPLMRQMKVSYKYGTEGINPKSDLAKESQSLAHIDVDRPNELLDILDKTRSKIGKDIEKSLTDATVRGDNVNLSNVVGASLENLEGLAQRFPSAIEDSTKAQNIFKKIALAGDNSSLSPTDTHDLIDYVDHYIKYFKPSAMTNPESGAILDNLYKTRSAIANELQSQIPEYGLQASRYKQFMKVPEQLISGSTPIENNPNLYYSRLNNADKTAFQKMQQLTQGRTKPGSGSTQIRTAGTNFEQRLRDFDIEDMQRVAKGEIPENALGTSSEDFINKIKTYSDDAVARGAMDAISPHTGMEGSMVKAITGTGETGRAMSLSAANFGGRISRKIGVSSQNNPITKITRSIYTAPHDSVLSLSQKLQSTPGLEKYGKSLEEALNSSDQNRRNQVLFTIMQNPNARAFVRDENETEEQQ